MTVKELTVRLKRYSSLVLRVLIVRFESSGSRSVLGRVMSSVSRAVSVQTPMRGMIEEQSVQSASVKGSMLSSESVIDASNMSSVSIVKEGSESSGMSELVDRMLKYQPPPNLTAEMGETVDDVIKYMKSTAELLRNLQSWVASRL